MEGIKEKNKSMYILYIDVNLIHSSLSPNNTPPFQGGNGEAEMDNLFTFNQNSLFSSPSIFKGGLGWVLNSVHPC